MLTHFPLVLGQMLGSTMIWTLVGVGIFVMFLFSMMIFIAKQYKRCPSNRVLVIYGRTGKGSAAKTIHGGASLVVPLIQDYAYLSLEPIQIDIPLRGALSSENIRVNVPSCFTVAIGTSPGVMDNAAVRLLGLTVGEIRKQAEELIFGQLRQVIASMRIEEINRDRDKLLEHIQSSLEPELNKIGLILINVNITDITDESGYIDAIGQKAASLAIQNARGDVAENLKMGEIRVAEADKQKLISVALANKEQVIGTREAERDQAIRVADMQKEQTIGERAAEYEREAKVKDAEREKRVRIAEADATAIEGENLSSAKIAASQAALAVKRAEAYQTGRRNPQERGGSGGAGSPKPRDGQSGDRRSGTGRSREAGLARSSGKGRKGEDGSRRVGRSGQTPHPGSGRSRRDLRQARSGSPR
ncbi:flotillin family protein [Blastopirellula retiformator]|uniref:Inner membrane protein YqiK n=1 Tax=Blastopirellula retiformator TaxID=2527970 RepID=A0A5C5UX12_9BACT|nr:flotillin family protein [Blastopirellula retiformator]TWT30097.1 Inner membrane protein YqiK [Blastopirellula retiformator]